MWHLKCWAGYKGTKSYENNNWVARRDKQCELPLRVSNMETKIYEYESNVDCGGGFNGYFVFGLCR